MLFRSISIGASADKKLGLENEDAEGVLSAVEFLRGVGKGEILDLTGKEVVVVGGGNVSMDAVRTAKRMGAQKVSILYRRRRYDMTALPAEVEGAKRIPPRKPNGLRGGICYYRSIFIPR